MTHYVYVITHTASKRHYVGKSAKPRSRWQSHQSAARRDSQLPLHVAIRADGVDAFQMQSIESFDSEADAYEAEAHWVDFLRTWDPDFGFNLQSGGKSGFKVAASTCEAHRVSSTGRKHSEETLCKMSLVQSGHPCAEATRRKIGKANTGKKRTEEQLERLSASLVGKGKGIPKTAEHAANVRAARIAFLAGMSPEERVAFDAVCVANRKATLDAKTPEQLRESVEKRKMTLAQKTPEQLKASVEKRKETLAAKKALQK